MRQNTETADMFCRKHVFEPRRGYSIVAGGVNPRKAGLSLFFKPRRGDRMGLFLKNTYYVFLVLCLLIPSGCNPKTQTPVTINSGYRQVMGTFARIVVVADFQQQGCNAINIAFEKINSIEKRMSDYDPVSLLSAVNRDAFASPVTVDDELFEVLSVSVEYSRISGGAFDITVGPIVQLWRKAKEIGTAPTQEQLQQAGQSVGYQHLILNAESKTVQFAKEGMFLDLGGVAKGYAVDRAIDILTKAGLKGGMVDIGGNLRCFGTPANDAEHWLIGLQDPTNDENILLKLKMDDHAVATSGDYRRFIVIDGQKHSHIINPATTDSAKGLSSVTIITSTAIAADALSTSVSVLGKEKGLEFIETIENAEAFLLDDNQTDGLTKTSAADHYIVNK